MGLLAQLSGVYAACITTKMNHGLKTRQCSVMIDSGRTVSRMAVHFRTESSVFPARFPSLPLLPPPGATHPTYHHSHTRHMCQPSQEALAQNGMVPLHTPTTSYPALTDVNPD